MGLYSRHSSVVKSISVLFAITSLWCGNSFATITLSANPTGLSSFVPGATDGTTTTKPTIYAGFAGTCSTGMDNISPCNSCVSTTGLFPCNPQNVYPGLILRIQLAVSNSSVTTATDVFLEYDKATVVPDTATYSGNILTLEIPWSKICAAAGWNNCIPTTTNSFSGSLVAGFTNIGTGATSDTFTFNVQTRYMDGTVASTYPDCDIGDPLPATTVGFCHFKAYPGDGKLYADELTVPETGYPSSPVSSIDYSGIIFYFLEQTAGETNTDTLNRINNTTPYTTIGINTRLKPPAGDNRITGLKNETPYCLIMANKDQSGIISNYTSYSGLNSQDPAALCATPSKVVGLLDDKSCFIATAAFGSDMAPEVQSFRDFRNKVLFSTEWGTHFVRFYYKHSPKYAQIIAQNNTARLFIRGLLWPLLVFAKLSVAIGTLLTCLLTISFATGFIWLFRRYHKRGLA